jgi:glutathione-specific gamma-glutamylcyclotransferase
VASLCLSPDAALPNLPAMADKITDQQKRQLKLTEELVRRVHRELEDPGYDPATSVFSEKDYDDHLQEFLSEKPAGPLYVFAYGSLIWKPAFDYARMVRGTAQGWRRSFCLRLTRFRGTAQQPGLMMALDRGGTCEGFVQQLHEGREYEELQKLWRREMTMKPPTNRPRWIEVKLENSNVLAIAFTANPKRPNYAADLSPGEISRTLSIACGHWGSGADYLHQTVNALEAAGIHDPYLWQLQELVAEHIIARCGNL